LFNRAVNEQAGTAPHSCAPHISVSIQCIAEIVPSSKTSINRTFLVFLKYLGVTRTNIARKILNQHIYGAKQYTRSLRTAPPLVGCGLNDFTFTTQREKGIYYLCNITKENIKTRSPAVIRDDGRGRKEKFRRGDRAILFKAPRNRRTDKIAPRPRTHAQGHR